MMELAIAAGAYHDLMSVMSRLLRDAPTCGDTKRCCCLLHVFIPLFSVLLYFFASRLIVELAPPSGLRPESGHAPYWLFSSTQEGIAALDPLTPGDKVRGFDAEELNHQIYDLSTYEIQSFSPLFLFQNNQYVYQNANYALCSIYILCPLFPKWQCIDAILF